MQEDKIRWNEKYQNCPMPTAPSRPVARFCAGFTSGRALDIACGTGRNTLWMAQNGLDVDAVDISDYALSQLPDHARIHPIEADLDTYRIAPGSYDLIVNCYYLNRRLFPYMIAGLRSGGLIVIETFLQASGEHYHIPSNPDYVLRTNELLHAFIGLDILFYEEREDENLRGERVRLATLVGKRR